MVSIVAYSQAEPKNNLGKTLVQLAIEFPQLRYWGEYADQTLYKDGDNMMFGIKGNRVVSEFMLIEGEGNYPHDWFVSVVNAFYKTNYQYVSESDNAFTFSYSYFYVYVSYSSYDNTASISYDYLPKYRM